MNKDVLVHHVSDITSLHSLVFLFYSSGLCCFSHIDPGYILLDLYLNISLLYYGFYFQFHLFAGI